MQILPVLGLPRLIVDDYVNGAVPWMKSMRLKAPLGMCVVEAVKYIPIAPLNFESNIKLFAGMIVMDVLPFGEREL